MRHLLLFWAVLGLAACAALPVPSTQPSATPAALVPTLNTTPDIDPTEAPPTTQPVTPTSDAQTVPTGGEILALSGGDLVGISVADQSRRTILSGVSDFMAAPDGQRIAAIRGLGSAGELWSVNRDGTAAKQHTDDQRSLAGIVWLPDNSGIVYAASATDSTDRYSADRSSWLAWAAFCRQSTIIKRVWDDPREIPMGEGCDPAVSPDGKRIAYATRPTRSDTSAADPGETAGNTIHLINVAGQNGWDPVSATGAEPGQPGQGLVVYGPVWSRDSRQLMVSVFIGNRVETDINLLTLVDASTAAQQLLGTSAGWNRAVTPSPDGSTYVLTAQNTGNARGSMGWDTWQTMVMDFVGTREMYLPAGTYTATGNPIGETLVRGQFAAWQPDGQALAVVLPPDWDPSIAPNEDYGRVDEPGELWLWPVGGIPSAQTSAPIDAGSPIQWLP